MPSKLARGLKEILTKGADEAIVNAKLVSFAQQKFDAARALRRIFEVKWYFTRAFVKGDQYVFWNKGTGHLDRHRAIDPRLRQWVAS